MNYTIECWENQRYVAFKGWGQYRLPTDRPSWSDKKGAVPLHREAFLLPMGWEWSTAWEVEPHGDNVEGWYYASDFTVSTKSCGTTPSTLSLVRRRKWVRTRHEVSEGSRNVETLWHHSVWCGSISYGFPGGSTEQLEYQQKRQHFAFMHLQVLLKSDANTGNQVNSPAVGSSHEHRGASEDHTPGVAVRHNRGTTAPDASPNMMSAFPISPSSDSLSTPLRCKRFSELEADLRSPNTAIAGTPMSLPLRKHVDYVYKFGVPNCLRRHLWMRWSGAIARRSQFPGYFSQLADRASLSVDTDIAREITQDVVRTAPNHPFFNGKGSPGTLRLTNTLMSLTLHTGLPEYHQAFSYIVALLLLNMTQEDAFWLMTVILQHFLSDDYHYGSGLQVDLRIIAELVSECYPDLDEHFQAHQIDVSVFASGWIQGMMCAHFPFVSAARFFDIMFAEGDTTLLARVPLAFMKIHRDQLMAVDGSGAVGQMANQWSREKHDVEDVCAMVSVDGLGPRIARRRQELLRANGTSRDAH